MLYVYVTSYVRPRNLFSARHVIRSEEEDLRRSSSKEKAIENTNYDNDVKIL